MIENAVASTLMRLPVAELSALRKASKLREMMYDWDPGILGESFGIEDKNNCFQSTFLE